MTCSQCFGNELRRSRLRWYEYILSLLHIRPFRCKSCMHRALHFDAKTGATTAGSAQ